MNRLGLPFSQPNRFEIICQESQRVSGCFLFFFLPRSVALEESSSTLADSSNKPWTPDKICAELWDVQVYCKSSYHPPTPIIVHCVSLTSPTGRVLACHGFRNRSKVCKRWESRSNLLRPVGPLLPETLTVLPLGSLYVIFTPTCETRYLLVKGSNSIPLPCIHVSLPHRAVLHCYIRLCTYCCRSSKETLVRETEGNAQ